MLSHCLFCGRKFFPQRPNVPPRQRFRLAFDPSRMRIWTVCRVCHGWNLWPREERLAMVDELERTASHIARLLYQTSNIALLDAGELELIRVGRAGLPETAWWRYGRMVRQRRDRYQSRLSRVGAVTYGAVSYLGSSLGFSRITGQFDSEGDVYADIIRWRKFGRTAWVGRAPCPQCRSVLLKLFFYKSAALLILPTRNGQVAIGLPCSRCDPWTEKKVHRLEGQAAEHVLRRVLAYRNISGASQDELTRAVDMIERSGSAPELISTLASEGTALYELDRTRSVALEISVNESAERCQLETEVAALEARWRREELLAEIIDEELSMS